MRGRVSNYANTSNRYSLTLGVTDLCIFGRPYFYGFNDCCGIYRFFGDPEQVRTLLTSQRKWPMSLTVLMYAPADWNLIKAKAIVDTRNSSQLQLNYEQTIL